MRVPLSWLREHVDLPEGESGRTVAERLVRVGLEVETVEEVGAEITGPLVVGRVLEFTEETHANGKTIRWCQVDVGAEHADADGGRGIVCGALNFAVGDLVVVSLPGAVLPGGFAISARQTYGHVSDGMICSARELALGDEADGILVLPPGTASPGEDAVVVLGLRDEVLDIAVTPDRGYALSVRGVAREAATAYGVPLRDPAAVQPPEDAGPDWPVTVVDAGGCDRFVARTVTGFDESAPSPWWLQRRVQLAGMRPISLAVDVTNYVMLELGQPLHAYDRQRLSGPIVVRRAAPGEQLQTLDGSTRVLDPDDLVIADDTGVVGIAGVMGGAATEIGATTTDIVIEAAHFDPTAIARAARRHRLPSEASRRFERGVDSRLQEAAAERAVRLLAELGGAAASQTATVVDLAGPPERITLELGEPARLVGYPYPHGEVVRLLVGVGCDVEVDGPRATVTPPSWRPDLQLTADLVEEVARLHGYDAIPSRLPQAPAGGGLTPEQRLRRRVGLALAGAGYVEVLTYPFVGPGIHDVFALDPDDHRRRALRLVNPLSDEEPDLRTTLLPGLLGVLRRNVGRGFGDVGLFESGLVYRAREGAPARAPRPAVASRPSDAEVAALLDALPDQPRHVAVVLAGDREPAGWWGPARPAVWADTVEAARTVAGAVGAALTTRAGQQPPWHPGRCAELVVADAVVGHAGELHPRTVAALGLPARTCAMELDLDALTRAAGGPVPAPQVSPFPVAKEDVALVVDETVPVADVQQALREGAGPLLESVRLFDVYTGPQVGEGRRSLAFALRFRADDRTLTEGEVGDARAGAVAEAGRRTGAVLRG